MEILLDGENAGKMLMSDFQIKHRVMHPLMRTRIIKPSIHLYQPIMQPDTTGAFQSGFIGDYSISDSYLVHHTTPPYPSGKGILFNQYQDRVEPEFNLEKPLEFQSVSGFHSRPMSERFSQIYSFQKMLFDRVRYKASNQELRKAIGCPTVQ